MGWHLQSNCRCVQRSARRDPASQEHQSGANPFFQGEHMTLKDLKETLSGLPQLRDSTRVLIGDLSGGTLEVTSVEYEPEYDVVIVQSGEEADV